MTDLKSLSPAAAAALVKEGALLVDIREPAERQSGVIPDAAHAPLSKLETCDIPAAPGQPVIFHCRSGGRTAMNAAALAGKVGGSDAYLLEGGIDGWRSQGLPVVQPE